MVKSAVRILKAHDGNGWTSLEFKISSSLMFLFASTSFSCISQPLSSFMNLLSKLPSVVKRQIQDRRQPKKTSN